MSAFGMNEAQLHDYVTKRLKNDNDALDAYYSASENSWAALATDSGCPRGYIYMGTYTCENGKVSYKPR